MGQTGLNPQQTTSDGILPGPSHVSMPAPGSDGAMLAPRSDVSMPAPGSGGSTPAHQSAGSMVSSGSNILSLSRGETEVGMTPVIIGIQVTIVRKHKMKV